MRYPVRDLLLFTTLVALVVGAIAAHRNYYRRSASGVSAAVANRMLWDYLSLPLAASDVTYYSDWGGCEAEFAIGEAEFLGWCDSRSFKVTEIGAPIAYFEPILLRQGDDRLVADGYTFEAPDGQGVFDRDAGRAAFVVSTFP